jgi:CspA family cold shock protein
MPIPGHFAVALFALAFSYREAHMRVAGVFPARAPTSLELTYSLPACLSFPEFGAAWPQCPATGRTEMGKGPCEMRIQGTVKFFNATKGFGFIKPDNGGKDVFVHVTALEAAGINGLNEGDKVSFILEDDRKGRGQKAAQLELV